jgi:Ca2+-binding RTX toxin-like protein
VGWRALGASLGVSVIAVSGSLCVGVPSAQAKNGDTHITGQGINQTLDCNESALIVVGTGNNITAVGTCWAVSVQGSSNVVVADNVINDITVYGYDQTVLFHNGDPYLLDRGRELGMTNRIDRVPA